MLDLIVTNTLEASKLTTLKQRFLKLTTTLQIPDSVAITCFNELISLYRSTSRHYHNLAHIWNFCTLIEQYQGHIEEPALFELTAWYHDAIYEVKRKDNEVASIELARERLHDYLDEEQLQYMDDIIRSTIKHEPVGQHKDTLHFLDFDLAILAAAPAVYKAYCEAVWQEYRVVYKRWMYRLGRRKVLKAFIGRQQIFLGTAFSNEHDQAARTNLKLELDNL